MTVAVGEWLRAVRILLFLKSRIGPFNVIIVVVFVVVVVIVVIIVCADTSLQFTQEETMNTIAAVGVCSLVRFLALLKKKIKKKQLYDYEYRYILFLQGTILKCLVPYPPPTPHTLSKQT